MVTALFSGNSAYEMSLTASVSGSTVTAVIKVTKKSGSGYMTNNPQDYGLSIDGVSYDGTWTYDFRNSTPQTITVRTASRNTGYKGSVSVRAWVKMDSGLGRAPSSGTIGLTVNVITRPNAPATPTVNNITSSSARVNWSLPANNGAALDEGRVSIGKSSNFSDATNYVIAGNATSYTRSGLDTATTYYTRVRFHNAGGWGDWSGARSFTTLAVAPSTPAAPTLDSKTSDQVVIDWTAPNNGGSAITGYDVQFATSSSFSNATTVGLGNVLTYTRTGLAPGTTYYWRVRATNAIGDSNWSSALQVTTNAEPPDTPTGLGTNSRTTTSIGLSWLAPATNGAPITAYTLQIANNSSFTGATTAYSGTSTSATVSNLDPGTRYYFRVRATNSAGSSAYSASIWAETLIALPSAPTGLAVSDVLPTSVVLDWDAPANDGGGTISGYRVQRATNSAFTAGLVTYTQGNTRTRTITDLEPATEYFFRVAATNEAGTGPYSSTATALTMSGAYYSTGSIWVPCGVYASDGSAWEVGVVNISNGSAWEAAT